jgi:glycosyltransferase involved in cell wall biosynthesis
MDNNKEDREIVIPDTSLCAIVRDEKMNPAGGIIDFVECIVPFVEEAIIVDTGSLDGTREILEELGSKYQNLKIFDHKWKGYADGRNFSLDQAKTRLSLILDADERFTKRDYKEIKKKIDENPEARSFAFKLLHVKQDYANDCGYSGHCERLFDTNLDRYSKSVWETLPSLELAEDCDIRTGVYLKHFDPDLEGDCAKGKNWYRGGGKDPAYLTKQPCEVEGFFKWKKLSPMRKKLEEVKGQF